MISVFWKEIRENWRWALLAFAAMAAALALAWLESPLVFDGALVLAGMVAVFTTIALGIMQTRRDNRPAARALLLHRGITADAAFAGKLLAGFAFYSFAVFVPILAMAIFIAINGIEHRAASAMSLVPMALLAIAAFGLWPASLLIVQRDARSLGSRLMPAVPALLAVFMGLAAASVRDGGFVFLLISVLNLSVLLFAARSVFTNNGQIATGIARATLALTISIGFLVVFLFGALTVETYRVTNGHASSDPRGVYAVLLGPEGEPWLGLRDYSDRDATYQLGQVAKLSAGRSVRDELGPVAEGWEETPSWLIDEYCDHLVQQYWARFVRIAGAAGPGSVGSMPREWVFDHKADAILVYQLTVSGGWQQPRWQLVEQLRAPGQVRSFGEIRQIGKSDREGTFTLVTSTGAFYIPGDGSAVVAMYQAPSESPILDSVDNSHRPEYRYPMKALQEKGEPFSMMLRLADRVVLLESHLDGTAVAQARPVGEVGKLGRLYATEIQLPDELAEPETLSIARDPLHSGTYLGLAQSGDPSERRIVWARFDGSGRIAAQQEYTENTGSDVASNSDVFIASVPPGLWGAAIIIGIAMTDDYSIAKAWKEAWAKAKEDPSRTAATVLHYLCSAVVGVPLSIWAARRRRLGKGQTWLCIAWGFLMGPAGSLSILAVYPQIIREECVSCRQPTRIDLDRCEHCGHCADDVPRLGIEVFDRDLPATSQMTAEIRSC